MYELLIKNLTRYGPLDDPEIRLVQSRFSIKRFRKHQFILQEGDVARYETFIVKGLTRTYEIDEKGQEHIIQFGLEDWWIGDLYSFLTQTPSHFNIDCLEDTGVLRITKEQLEQLYLEVPKLERHFRILIQNAFISSTKRISSSLRLSAAERYSQFVRTYPEIERRVPNHQIASFLGITPQSLSRIRGKSSPLT
jgi:CRP-like cAMP-binding protein